MTIDVFISHHTSSCLPIVEGIATKFESHGVRCWYAPRNTTGPYAQSISAAIASCRVFLLILNHQSSESFDVKNEINLACDRIRRGEDLLILPFRIADDEISEDVKYYIGRMHWIDAVTPPMEKRMNELLERVLLHLDRKPSVELRAVAENTGVVGDPGTSGMEGASGVPDSSGATKTAANSGATAYTDRRELSYRITSARMYPNSRFVGRKQELAELRRMLSGGRNKVFLLGMGGLGKSEIAKKYCDDYSEEYDIIKWVTFSGTLQETIASDQLFDIEGMQKADFPGDDERAYFLRKLHLIRGANRRVLFVIDNFDVDGDADLDDFCAGEYSVIFTTRNRQETDTIPQMELQPMEEDELLAIFLADAGRSGTNMSSEDNENIREIIRHLQLHTYGVRIAASVMKKQRMKPQEMLSLLRQDAGTAAKRNVKKAESEILERIRKLFDLSSLNEEAVYILRNLYFMPLGGVQVELFAEWCELDGYDEIDALIDRSWVVHEASTDTIHLHPLIVELMAGPVAEDISCCETMLKNMAEESDRGKYHSFGEKQMRLNCEMSFYNRQPENSPYRRKALFLVADRLNDMSCYRESTELWKQELYAEDLDETDRAYLYFKISHALIGLEKADEALQVATEGWEHVRDLLLDRIPMKLGYYRWEIYTRLIEANRKLGNYDLSIQLAREGLPDAGRFYAESPELAKGWARFHLASSLYSRNAPGDDEEALSLFKEAIELFDRISNVWSQSFCYEMMSQIQTRQGRFAEALANNERAYEILVPITGDGHTNVGDNLLWRGDTYRAMGDEKNAVECYERALDIFRKKKSGVKEKRALERLGRNL